MPSKRDDERASFKTTLSKTDDVGSNSDLERRVLDGRLTTVDEPQVSALSINDLRIRDGQRARDA